MSRSSVIDDERRQFRATESRRCHRPGMILIVHKRKPPQAANRHHYDYAYSHFGQRLVESTAAAKDNSSQLAGDADSASSTDGMLCSVRATEAGWPEQTSAARYVSTAVICRRDSPPDESCGKRPTIGEHGHHPN